MSKKYYDNTNESLYNVDKEENNIIVEETKNKEIEEEEKSEMKQIETKMYQLTEVEVNRIIKNHLLNKNLINEDDEIVININKAFFSKKIKDVEVVSSKVTIIN